MFTNADHLQRLRKDRIQDILNIAREALRMDVAFVSALDGDEQTFTHLAGDGESFGWRTGMTIPEVGAHGHDGSAAEPLDVVPDAPQDGVPARLAAASRAGIESYAGVPLTLGSGRVYGALCVISHAHQPLDGSDVAFMNLLGNLISTELSQQEQQDTGRSLQLRDLASWLAPSGMSMHLQPIVQLGSRAAWGYEALARFHGHPGSPSNVFAAAGLAGMGAELELAAVRNAVALLHQLPEPLVMSINVSSATLDGPELLETLLEHPGDRLMVELTDQVDLAEQFYLRPTVRDLQAHGVRVALDEKGSGFAELQGILALAPDVLKLDIGLVRAIDSDPVRRSLLRSLVGFAEEAEITLIAEGIETREQLDTLEEIGITLGQGRLLGAPAPIEAKEA